MSQKLLTAYASRTGTLTTLAALRAAQWKLLVSATGVQSNEGFPYMVDNGAWTAFQKSKPFDEVKFKRTLARFGAEADFVVVPDIVEGGAASWTFSLSWLERVKAATRLALLAVQDGMTHELVRPWLNQSVGVFVGGSTEWKKATIPYWGKLARDFYVHVGRVNTRNRIKLCADAGVHSFDGTSVTKFPSTLELLERSRQDFPRKLA